MSAGAAGAPGSEPSGEPGELVLRRAHEADDAAIRALLRRSYSDNPKAEAAYTRWQYWDNPFGPTRSWVWAEPSGRVVGHWSAVAVPLWMGGHPTTGAKGVDIATDPDWRGRGLFSGLARRLLADCREAGVPALLSHPNPSSAPAVTRAGARQVARVPVWVRPVDPEWLAGRLRLPTPAARALARTGFRARAAPDAGALRVDEVSEPPSDLDALWATVASPQRYGVARDAAWWRWRYAQRPHRPYRILTARSTARVRTRDGHTGRGQLRAAAVTTVRPAVGGAFAHVLEWMAADDAAAAAIGRALAEAGGAAAVDGAVVAALPGTELARQARRAGFRRLPRALEPRPLRFLVAGGPASDPNACDRLARAPWSFAWGDVDHL